MEENKAKTYNQEGTYALIHPTGEVVVYGGEKQIFRSKLTADNTRIKLSKLFFTEISVKKMKPSRDDLRIENKIIKNNSDYSPLNSFKQ